MQLFQLIYIINNHLSNFYIIIFDLKMVLIRIQFIIQTQLVQ